MTDPDKATGSCMCGKVSFEIEGPMRSVVFCHCEQCRKWTGHFVAATAVKPEQLRLSDGASLTWHQSSDVADRGYCKDCGSSMFWRPGHGIYICVMAGTIDAPTGLSSREHIYTDYASDYCPITDGLPQYPEDHAGLWETDWK